MRSWVYVLFLLIPSLVTAEPTSYQRYFIDQKASLHDLALFKANMRSDARLKDWFFQRSGFFFEVMDDLDWARKPEEPYKSQDFYVPFGQDWKSYNSYNVDYDWDDAVFIVTLSLHWEIQFDSFSRFGIVKHTSENARKLCLPLLNYIAKFPIINPDDFSHGGYTVGRAPSLDDWSKELNSKMKFIVRIEHTNSRSSSDWGSYVSCEINGTDYRRFADRYWSDERLKALGSQAKALGSIAEFSMKGNW